VSKRNVVVVGAGIGGLSAAHWLTRRGYDVEVLEAADRPGGRMQLLERRGDLVDVGAQFFHSSYESALGLIDELGLAGNRRTISAGTQFARPDGSKFVLRHDWDFPCLLGPGGSASLMAFGLRYLVFGKRFPMSQIVRSIPAYDDVSVADIVSRSHPRHLDYVVRPVCFYFGDPSEDRSFNMAVDQTARVPDMAPSGKAIVSAWAAYPRTEELIARADDRLIETALEDMEKLIPGFSGWVEDVALVRHGWGNAVYPPGQYQGVIDFRRKAEALEGISFVGSPYGGVHMEAAILAAKRAVTRVNQGQ